MNPQAEIIKNLVELSCLSDICAIIEETTGCDDPKDVAHLLLNELKKSNFSEETFLKAIWELDETFPHDILQSVYKTIVDRMRSLPTYEDDIFAAIRIHDSRSKRPDEFVFTLHELVSRLEIMTDNKRIEDFKHLEWSKRGDRDHTPSSLFSLRQLNHSESAKKLDLGNKAMNRTDSLHSPEIDMDIRLKTEPPCFLHQHQKAFSTQKSFSTHLGREVTAQKKIGCVSQAISQQRTAYKERKECTGERKNSKYSETLDSAERASAVHLPGALKSDTPNEDRQNLQVYKVKSELLNLLEKVQVLVVIGETGSGKTTQIPQYLVESGYARNGKLIGCTQPRRLPAKGIAERVANEFGCSVGEEVGYTMRFEDKTSKKTLIRYMTDGILLREALLDPFFKKYSVVIIDEAHERNINTDLLLGLLKRALFAKNFKLIVTSATLNVEKFTRFFEQANVFYIEGRTFPVTISYINNPLHGEYVYESVKKAMECHLAEEPGDVLVFLPGKEEIEDAADRTLRWGSMLPASFPRIQVHRVYASLPTEVQAQVFSQAPKNTRKIIFSTNVAETSVTIDGVRYVIDPGVFKQSFFHPKSGMEVLGVFPISQAQANQRAGRAGRTAPGKCFRLYTEDSFKEELLADTIPEIQRSNLANIVLLMKATGVHDVIGFEFIDRPLYVNLVHALHQLFALGALDEEGLLTAFGRKMSEYPIDPSMSKTLIASFDLGCTQEVITILAVLSVSDEIYYRPREDSERADARRSKLQHCDGDHLTILSIYERWQRSKYSRIWCEQNYLNHRALSNAEKIREELSRMVSKERQENRENDETCPSLSVRIRLAFLSGFFHNVAKRSEDGYEVISSEEKAYIFPSSAVYGKDPPFVMFQSIMMTSREFMRVVSPIEPSWLVVVAPKYFVKKSDLDTVSSREEKLEPLFNKNLGPDQWRFSDFYQKRAKRR